MHVRARTLPAQLTRVRCKSTLPGVVIVTYERWNGPGIMFGPDGRLLAKSGKDFEALMFFFSSVWSMAPLPPTSLPLEVESFHEQSSPPNAIKYKMFQINVPEAHPLESPADFGGHCMRPALNSLLIDTRGK